MGVEIILNHSNPLRHRIVGGKLVEEVRVIFLGSLFPHFHDSMPSVRFKGDKDVADA